MCVIGLVSPDACIGLVVSPDVPVTVDTMSMMGILPTSLNTDASNVSVPSALLHLTAASHCVPFMC